MITDNINNNDMRPTFITYADLKELLKDFQLVHQAKHYDEQQIDYDEDTEFIGVGPWAGPIKIFNDWNEAVEFMRQQVYETYLGVYQLEWNSAPDKTVYPVQSHKLYPYAVINEGRRAKPQPICKCRQRKPITND